MNESSDACKRCPVMALMYLRWQTVPDLGTSNRKGSVANGGPVGLWLDEAARAA